MAQHLVRIILLGSQIVGRAFAKALKNEFQHARVAQEARGQSNQTVQATRLTGITLEEAKQILNVNKLERTEVEEKFKHLFEVNDKAKGGSFYIQSKVYRAKERLDEELKLKEPAAAKPKEES